MKPTRQTAPVSACLAALPMPLTSCPLTVPATAALSPSWCTRSKPRFTFWRTKPLPEPISARCGRKQWRFTEAACSSCHSAQPCSGISKNTSGILCRRDTKAGMIQAYLDKYTGETVCSKQLYKEALNHTFDEPKQWEIRGNQRDNEPVHYRVELLFQSEDVCGIRQTKGAGSVNPGNGHRQPARKIYGRFCGGHRADGASILKMTAVADFVAIPLPSRLPGKIPYFRAFSPL